MITEPGEHIRIDVERLTTLGQVFGAMGRGPLHEAGVALANLLRELDVIWGAPAQQTFRSAGGAPLMARLGAAERDLERVRAFLDDVIETYATLEAGLAQRGTTDVRRPGKPPGLSRPPLQDGVGPTTYVIVAGDTLWDIARRFDTTVEALRAANGITGHLIYPGQSLIVPAPDTAPRPIEAEPIAPVGAVRVHSGDTLWGIAVAHGITVADLRRANGIGGDLIYPGQLLIVPAAGAPLPAPTLQPGAAVLLADSFISGYAWLAHPGHHGIDLNTPWADKTLRAPYPGTRIVADPCPALTAGGDASGQMSPGSAFGPENNWGYGAMTVVETRYEELTAAQIDDLAARGVSVHPGQSLYLMTAHLQPDLVPAAGTALQAGDPIARMGTSGNSTGPHAHVEVAVTASGLRPGDGQSAAAFWIGAVVGVSNGAAASGTRIDPTPLFVGGP